MSVDGATARVARGERKGLPAAGLVSSVNGATEQGSENGGVPAPDRKASAPPRIRKRCFGLGEGQRRPGFSPREGCLTVLPPLCGQDPRVNVLQGAVKGELEPGVGEDGNQGGVQAFVEHQGAFGPVHGHHGVSQRFIHLDGTQAARVSAWGRPGPRTQPITRTSPRLKSQLPGA